MTKLAHNKAGEAQRVDSDKQIVNKDGDSKPTTIEAVINLPVRSDKEEKILRAYVNGVGALSLFPGMAETEAERETFFIDGATLRNEIARQHGSVDMLDLLLADAAVLSYYQTRKFSALANLVLQAGCSKPAVENAQALDKLTDRAHRRLLSVIETLRGKRNGPVKMEIGQIGQVGNICTGDQVVTKKDDSSE